MSFPEKSVFFHEMQCSCSPLVARGCKRIAIFWKTITQHVRNLNIFPSVPASEDSRFLQNQRISTWLFIASLITSAAVLLFYNTFVPVQKTFTVKQPSHDQYLTLFSKYPNNLQCPCKTVSVTHDKFLSLNYSLHHVCSSLFVSEQWIQYLTRKHQQFAPQWFDFRAGGHFAFQALRSFCELTNETIRNSLRSFYATQYVSAYLTASDLFRQQNDAQI